VAHNLSLADQTCFIKSIFFSWKFHTTIEKLKDQRQSRTNKKQLKREISAMTWIEKLETKKTSWENEKINFFFGQFVGIKESIQSSHSSFKLLSQERRKKKRI
jgi:hypothetical protein